MNYDNHTSRLRLLPVEQFLRRFRGELASGARMPKPPVKPQEGARLRKVRSKKKA